MSMAEIPVQGFRVLNFLNRYGGLSLIFRELTIGRIFMSAVLLCVVHPEGNEGEPGSRFDFTEMERT